MEAFVRKDPSFALCGLNCCLCPRFNTEGSSRCPGCGGPDFASRHPTCAVATCNRKHDNVEYCFECSAFPCARYDKEGEADSFITYRNVQKSMKEAKRDLEKYLKDLRKRREYLNELLNKYNDGRSKGLYCLAANLLPLDELRKFMSGIERGTRGSEGKERAKEVGRLLKEKAKELGIELALRK